jgi:hypothetical protein
LSVEGPDFLARNSVLAAEIKRSLVDIDEMQKEIKKAANAIQNTKIWLRHARAASWCCAIQAGIRPSYRSPLRRIRDDLSQTAVAVALQMLFPRRSFS